MSIATFQTTSLLAPITITSLDIKNWDPSLNITPTPAPRGKGKGKTKEVVHHIFAYYASLVSDPFWADLFTQASYGKLPKKFTYNEMTLSYRRGQTQGERALYQTPESAQQAILFFQGYGTIYSPIDQQNAMFQHHNAQITAAPLTWATANRKTKISLINNYVEELRQLMKLSEAEAKQLEEVIHLGIGSKIFNRDNIGVDQHKIVVIQGLHWDDQQRYFYPDKNLKPTRSNSRSKSKVGTAPTASGARGKGLTPTFRNNWNKFLVEQIQGKQLSTEQQQAFNMHIRMNSSVSCQSDDSANMYDSDSDGEN